MDTQHQYRHDSFEVTFLDVLYAVMYIVHLKACTERVGSNCTFLSQCRKENALYLSLTHSVGTKASLYISRTFFVTENPTEEESGETTPAIEILPGMGTREFKR